MWNAQKIQNTDFFTNNKKIFDKYPAIGYGLFIWKPYIIASKLDEIDDGEFIYYQDASRYDNNGLENYNLISICEYMNENNIELLPGFKINVMNKYLIKEECLKYMDYNNNEDFLNKEHYNTSPLIFKKTQNTVQFIKEWLHFCQIPQCIIKNTRSHQCDQAIFNILLDKYNYKGILYTDDKNESKKYSIYWKKLIEYINNIQ